jgi:cytoskeletal protein RodZ
MSGEDSGPRTGLKIGRVLERAREERGLSLHQVEQATKIRARYLKELERENFEVLPTVFVQGSLRT